MKCLLVFLFTLVPAIVSAHTTDNVVVTVNTLRREGSPSNRIFGFAASIPSQSTLSSLELPDAQLLSHVEFAPIVYQNFVLVQTGPIRWISDETLEFDAVKIELSRSGFEELANRVYPCLDSLNDLTSTSNFFVPVKFEGFQVNARIERYEEAQLIFENSVKAFFHGNWQSEYGQRVAHYCDEVRELAETLKIVSGQ